MYEAFFFGPENRQLFGIYHPSVGADRHVLTLICPPLFSEFNRTHAALRQLAISLANAGHHVLRFDYAGTGDSYGNLDEFALADWEESIAIALQEGRELSGCDKVRVLGVRASCPLVCRAIGDHSTVDRIVLWDPVSDGKKYLRELRRGQQDVIKQNVHVNRATRQNAKRLYGIFQMSEPMEKDFLGLTTEPYLSIDSEKLCVVTTNMSAEFPVNDVSSEFVDFNCGWDIESEELVMCQPVLESLTKYLRDR